MKRLSWMVLILLVITLTACASQQPAAEQGLRPAAQNEVPEQVDMPVTILPDSAGNVAEPQIRRTAVSLDWTDMELTNVADGQSFKIADYQGKVVLVLIMAIDCADCTTQQLEVRAFADSINAGEELVIITIDLDAAENADELKQHAIQNGFAWSHAVGSSDLRKEITAAYGIEYTDPPSLPMLVIDRRGSVFALPLGFKSADFLTNTIQPLLEN